MNPFELETVDSVESAVVALSVNGKPAGKVIAGGTNLVDLMKYRVEEPSKLVDITRLALGAIEDLPDGGLRLGALASNSNTAYDERVQSRYPLLSQAILAGASPQLRNMATDGGNLLQRTRCYYFYDKGTACNKRVPGSGCPAIRGLNRIHAILGTSESCIATHPSDMCVALAALAATVRVTGPDGERTIPFKDFHRLPGDTPELDTNLQLGEVVTAIDLPADGFAKHSYYLKARDRQSYAFALVSVAATLELEGGTVKVARIALGGVAHKPWRDEEAESLLIGRPATRETFALAADKILAEARGFGGNTFKIDLARRIIPRALERAAEGTPAHNPADADGVA